MLPTTGRTVIYFQNCTENEKAKELDRLAAMFRERLAREWPDEPTDVTDIEDRVTRVEQEITHEITKTWVQAQTGQREGNRVACPCVAAAVYGRQLGIDIVTRHGRVRAERAYFYCSACKDGHCPQDRAWGIGPGNPTPGVQADVAWLASQHSYVQIPHCMLRLMPKVHLGTKTIELIAQRVGENIDKAPPRLKDKAERNLVAAVDGVMLPTNEGYKQARAA